MAPEPVSRRKAIVNALCAFLTRKPFAPPLESSDSYFKYKSNKLRSFPL